MDVVKVAAARHGCKVCGKSFLCGRSLGGHMRSHISFGEVAPKVHAADELTRSYDGVVGYGLRENPRKTRRLSDFADEEDVGHGVECGKSWRSLFGHMGRHASGDRYRDDDDEDVEEDEFLVEEGEAEMVKPTEAPVAALTVLSASPRRRRRSMRVAAPPTAPPPPPVPSGFEKETEDVALCLLMLSRDTGMCSSPAKNEPLESAKKIKIKGGVAKNRKRASRKHQLDPVAPKRTRYECPGCHKLFSSYQALGGHRASHKRMNASCSSPKITPAASSAPEPSTETYMSFNTLSPSASPDSVAIGFGKPKDDEAVPDAEFEHKRSHLMSCEANGVDLYYVDGAGADHQQQHSAAADGFLDLNFPPAAAEET